MSSSLDGCVPAAPGAPTTSAGGTRVVVADDDADIRRLITFTLRRRGYEVLEASAGDDALALIREQLPALAVLDMMMPRLTGAEVTEALRADAATATIPVMVVSADGHTAKVTAALDPALTTYLPKPFVPGTLAARVDALIKGVIG